MNFGKDPLALLLLVIVTSLAITALAFAVGSGLKNPAQASMLGLLLSLTLAPVGGAWWPMNISPKFLQIIGHVSPVAWAMDGFTAITYRGATLVDILVPMAVLAGMTIVLFLIAIHASSIRWIREFPNELKITTSLAKFTGSLRCAYLERLPA